MNDLIRLEVINRVAYIAIDRPPANALSRSLLVQLQQAVTRVKDDSAIKVAVIKGSGKMFVAGADIKEMAETANAAGSELAKGGQAVLNDIEQSPKPFIAALNGHCLGGGLELAMACHLRYAVEGAKLGQPEVNLGLIPGFGGTQRLTRLVGETVAMEMMLTGAPLSAERAHSLRLVNRVFPAAQLDPEVRRIAELIAAKSAVATREIVGAVRAAGDVPLAEGLDFEADAFGRAFASEDKREGIAAFIEKREPHFKDK